MSSGTVIPQIVKLTITAGAALPSATINSGDSVFWYNDTDQEYQLVYNSGGTQVHWGEPPWPLPKHQSSSQVVFTLPTTSPPTTQQTYSYTCTAPPNIQGGTITVVTSS
jgi:hypothetical protein